MKVSDHPHKIVDKMGGVERVLRDLVWSKVRYGGFWWLLVAFGGFWWLLVAFFMEVLWVCSGPFGIIGQHLTFFVCV